MRALILGMLLAASPLAEHAVVGAYPPQNPASSLDVLLRDVWAQGANKAYELYTGKSEVPMSAAARETFPQQMINLAADTGNIRRAVATTFSKICRRQLAPGFWGSVRPRNPQHRSKRRVSEVISPTLLLPC
jgi:hypothetical protein